MLRNSCKLSGKVQRMLVLVSEITGLLPGIAQLEILIKKKIMKRMYAQLEDASMIVLIQFH
jgi:hypothetical protein